MTSKTAVLWLKIVVAATALLGVVVAAAGVPTLGALAAWLIDLVVEPGAPVAQLSPASGMLAAVGGGMMIGWAVVAWYIVTRIETGDRRGTRVLLTSLVLWYVADSAGSIASGAPLNAASNTLLLALFLPPLVRLLRQPG